MTRSSDETSRDQKPLRALLREFVLPAIRERRPQRILMVSRDPGELPDLNGLARLGAVTLHAGGAGADAVRCSSSELPFQDDSFEVAVMLHVFSDGGEPELAEAERVLTGGGELFVLGRGNLGREAWFGASRKRYPGLRVRQLCRRLEQHSFRIEQCVGLGLAGVRVSCDSRWQQPALPFADGVLVRGRHNAPRPVVTHLRFSRPQTVGVRSTAAESLQREAV